MGEGGGRHRDVSEYEIALNEARAKLQTRLIAVAEKKVLAE
jgi:hypothetical protein